MNFIDKIKILSWVVYDRFCNLSLSDPKAWNPSLWHLHGSQSESGEVVTEETALQYSAVWNAVTLISGTIGSLPLHLMRPDGRNKKQATEETLYQTLHTQYNPYMTAMAGRECMALHILTWGNGYAEIVRNGFGQITALWPIGPNRVTPKMKDGEMVYDIKLLDGGEVTLPREQILHIPGMGFDGFMGYSIVSMARKSIGLGMAMETFGSKLFSQGMNPSAILKHPNQVKDLKAMREAFQDAYTGLGNANRLMLLEDGMSFEKIGIPAEDSQFLQSRQFQITDIARWFNLPVHKLKEMSKSSFNNIESEQASFVTDSILPWVVRFEQNCQMQLLSERQIKEGYYFKHVIEGLLRANAADRAEFYAKMWAGGIMTQNEIRLKEDLNPSSSPLADELFVPLNMIPISMLKEHLEKPEPKQIPETTEEATTDGKQNLYLLQKNKEL